MFLARKHKKSQHEIDDLKEKIWIEKAKHPKTGGRVTVVNNHHPVRMTEQKILRVEWNGLRPGINQIINTLKQKITVESEIKTKSYYTSGKPDKNVDDQVLDLAERGNQMEAISLVRIKYGYSLTEAKEFVENPLRK